MDFYSTLRAFADSWFLLAMTAFYLGVFLWVLRPGSRQVHADIAEIPLRNETLTNQPAAAACGKGCPDCTCASMQDGILPEERA